VDGCIGEVLPKAGGQKCSSRLLGAARDVYGECFMRRALVILFLIALGADALLAQDLRVPSPTAADQPNVAAGPEPAPALALKGVESGVYLRAALKAQSRVWFRPADAPPPSVPCATAPPPPATPNGHSGFQWATALKQSLLFLGVQHGYAMTQAKTRRELKGPFFKDYFRSVSKLSGWADGGRFFTNYISHPMEGSIAGFIQIQNDPKGRKQAFSKTRGYWTSRLKAMAWNAAYSTQFELGPLSQSSIGNVGLHTSLNGKKRKMAYVDLVVTPTLGTAWLIGEDLLDRFVVQRLEQQSTRPFVRNTARVLLNPMRGAANLLRFKVPWYRDR